MMRYVTKVTNSVIIMDMMDLKTRVTNCNAMTMINMSLGYEYKNLNDMNASNMS